MKHENKIEIFLCRLLDNKNFLVEILPRYGWKAELNAAKNINHWTRVRKFIEVSAFVKSPNLRWTQDIILWSISHIRSFQVKRPTFRGTNHNKMTKWNKAKKVSECMSIEWLSRKIRKHQKFDKICVAQLLWVFWQPNLSQQEYLGSWISSVIYVQSTSALKVSYKITRKMCTHFCSDCNIKFSSQDQKEHYQECGECNSIFKTLSEVKEHELNEHFYPCVRFVNW